jgi:hypothetical protein
MTVQRFRLEGDDLNRPNRSVILRLPWHVEQVDPNDQETGLTEASTGDDRRVSPA